MKLSIVICSYNREKYLPDALKSLTKQTLPASDFEIIIINNNSTDRTGEISLQFKADNPNLNIRYEIERNQGLSYARNKGIELAVGKYISFIDDDAIAEPDYAEKMINAFENYPAYDSVGGKVLPIYPEKIEPAWMSKYIQGVVSKVDYGEKTGPFSGKKYPVGCNMGFRREIFEELGGFNVELTLRNDDKYMFLKLRRNKKTILYAHDVVVHHNMDDYRLEDWFLRKLSIQIGATERVRLKKEPVLLTVIKPFEYLFKFGASILIGLQFFIKGQSPKARYLIWIRWLVFIGYFKNKY